MRASFASERIPTLADPRRASGQAPGEQQEAAGDQTDDPEPQRLDEPKGGMDQRQVGEHDEGQEQALATLGGEQGALHPVQRDHHEGHQGGDPGVDRDDLAGAFQGCARD
ncbi:hypothetical protein ACFELC_19115 [Pseudomonas aeruginosa]|uniref:hypothetical protein n=1 Tax=Pseudomonas aeruginosa TaxID=287 RepID=UPI00383BE951